MMVILKFGDDPVSFSFHTTTWRSYETKLTFDWEALENSWHFTRTYPWLPCETTSEEWLRKFQTDGVLLPRSGNPPS